MTKKITLCFCIFVFLLAGLASAKPRRISSLGNPVTAFHLPPLKTMADLQKMVKLRKADIQKILEMRGWKGNIDDLMRAVEAGTAKETTIERGAEIPFISYRRGGKPGVFEDVIWAGAKPFGAFLVEFESNGSTYQFFFPKPCSNFWWEDRVSARKTEPVMAPSVAVMAEDVCVTQKVRVKVTTANAEPGATVQFTLDGQTESMPASAMAEKELAAYNEPGSHTITVAMQGASPATATFNVKACPPVCAVAVAPAEIKRKKPFTIDATSSQVAAGITGGIKSASVEILREGASVETFEMTSPNLRRDDVKVKKAGVYSVKVTVTDEVGQKSTNTCEASFEVPKPKNPFFIAAFGGKERLVQDTHPGGLCAGLFGFEAGILPEIGEDLELELSIGGKINVEEGDNSSIFADVAINKIVGRGFLGGGVSFWDLTEEDTRSVALLIQFGFDLTEDGKVQFVGEGRAPFDQFDELDNNYQIWGGIRIRPWR